MNYDHKQKYLIKGACELQVYTFSMCTHHRNSYTSGCYFDVFIILYGVNQNSTFSKNGVLTYALRDMKNKTYPDFSCFFD